MTIYKWLRHGSLWMLAWVLAGWVAWSLPGYAAGAQMAPPASPVSPVPLAGPEALATVAGTSVEMSGAPVAFNAQGRLQIFDGARLQVARDAGAQLDLARGGTIRLCGPARVDLARGGAGALLIALDAGGVELRYAAAVPDSLLTPDFRLTTVVPPRQIAAVSANAGLEADGTLCLTNHGSALSVQNLWNGAQRFVIGGDSLEFHPGGATTAVAACPCASPAPAAVTTPASAEGALFPGSPALAVQANGAAGAATAAPPVTAAGARRQHHNAFVRFFRWLAGKN